MAEVTLSKAVRSNLLNLQSTAQAMSKTQERLATGLKVNSALDNPTNFFTASALNSRAGDLGLLLDSVSNAVQTLSAADKGITAITKLVESAQATARQALQTAATVTTSSTTGASPASSATVAGGAFTAVDVSGAGSSASAGSVTAGTFSTLNVSEAGSAAEAATFNAGTFTSLNVSEAGSAAEAAVVTAGAYTPVDLSAANTLTLTVEVDGDDGNPINVTLDNTITAVDNENVTGDELAAALSTAIAGVTVTFDSDNGNLVFTSDTTGAASQVNITAVGGTAAGDSGIVIDDESGADAVDAASLTFTLNVDGDDTNVTIDAATVAQYNIDNTATLDASALTADDVAALINDQVGANVASVDGDGDLVFTSTTTGDDSSLTLSSYTASSTAVDNSGLANQTEVTGADAVDADSLTFTISVDGDDTNVTIDAATVAQYNIDNTATLDASALTADDVAALINDQVGSAVASVNDDGDLEFTSGTTGSGSSVAISAVTETSTAGASGISAANDSGDDAVAADSISFSVNVDGAGAEAITISAAAVTQYNSDNSASLDASDLSADDIVALINDQAGASIASVNDDGAIEIASSTTGTSSTVAITGFTTAGTVGGSTGLANDTDTGAAANAGTTTTTTSANPKRDELREQYNELLTQIDDLTKDAGFNGVNLLRQEDLSVLFNEDGSSKLDITGVDFSSSGLGLSALAEGDFDTNEDINTTLASLKTGIESLRTQASKFGSNLSVVETRQDFTKNMINVLQTGAANLTLADTNEEAANLLALQTRQQLSSTALSLASQADQQVLRLF